MHNDCCIFTIFMLLPIISVYIFAFIVNLWNPFHAISFIYAQLLQSVVIALFCYILGYFFRCKYLWLINIAIFPNWGYKLKIGIKMLPVSLCQLIHVLYTHFSFMEQYKYIFIYCSIRKPYKHFTVLMFALILIFTLILRYTLYILLLYCI